MIKNNNNLNRVYFQTVMEITSHKSRHCMTQNTLAMMKGTFKMSQRLMMQLVGMKGLYCVWLTWYLVPLVTVLQTIKWNF